MNVVEAITNEIPTDIWDKFLEGESASFSKIYYMYAQSLYSYGLCFTNDHALLQDCIHEIFVKVYNARKTLRRESFRFYLIRSLRNELFNAFRDRKDTCGIEEFENEFMPVYSAEEYYIKEEQDTNLRKSVQKMLETLTPNQREAIYYRYEEDLSINEIAQIMGINYQSVQNLIQRSIQKLRKEHAKNQHLAIVLKDSI